MTWTAIGFLICTYAIPTAWVPALLTLLIMGVGYLLTVWIVQRVKMRNLASALDVIAHARNCCRGRHLRRKAGGGLLAMAD